MFQTETPNHETLKRFERKFDEKVVAVRITCECGEELVFPIPTLGELMLAFATHSC